MSPEGDLYAFGDVDHEFTIQSMSKPLVYGLAVGARPGEGPRARRRRALRRRLRDFLDERGRPVNPMINAGALTVHGLLREHVGGRADDLILEGLPSWPAGSSAPTGHRAGQATLAPQPRDRQPVAVDRDHHLRPAAGLRRLQLAVLHHAQRLRPGDHRRDAGHRRRPSVSGERVFRGDRAVDLSVMSTSGMYTPRATG